MDHWNLNNSLGVEIPKYKYVVVDYYYDSTNPTHNGRMKFSPMKSHSDIKEITHYYSVENMVTGKWAKAVFPIEYGLQMDVDNSIIWQFHLYPFGDSNPASLSENDVIYISKCTFYETNPYDKELYSVFYCPHGNGDCGYQLPTYAYSIYPKVKDEPLTIAPYPTIPNSDKTIIGWGTVKNGSQIEYVAGDNYTNNADITLFPVFGT